MDIIEHYIMFLLQYTYKNKNLRYLSIRIFGSEHERGMILFSVLVRQNVFSMES